MPAPGGAGGVQLARDSFAQRRVGGTRASCHASSAWRAPRASCLARSTTRPRGQRGMMVRSISEGQIATGRLGASSSLATARESATSALCRATRTGAPDTAASRAFGTIRATARARATMAPRMKAAGAGSETFARAASDRALDGHSCLRPPDSSTARNTYYTSMGTMAYYCATASLAPLRVWPRPCGRSLPSQRLCLKSKLHVFHSS